MAGFRQITIGVILALVSVIGVFSIARASGGVQPMTNVVGRGQVFLELGVLSVRRNQVHRTYHNGTKRLIRNEYEVVCKVIKNETSKGPKVDSEITLHLSDPTSRIVYDMDGKERRDVPRKFFIWNHSVWGGHMAKGVKFFAAFYPHADFRYSVYPLACRQITERDAWNAAVAQKKQAQLFLEALSKTMPKHWKPSNKAVRVTCRPTQENIGRKIPLKPTGQPKEDARQRELRVELNIPSPRQSMKAMKRKHGR
jgi:hypothetical protein